MHSDLSKLEISLAVMRMIPKFEVLKDHQVEYYYEKIKQLHRLAFIDTHRFDSGILRAGEIKREAVEELHLLLNSCIVGEFKLSLSKFYNEFLSIEPFVYGGELVLRKFLSELAKSYAIDLDFRRVASTHSIEEALNSSNKIDNHYEGEVWPKLETNIKTKNGKSYLNLEKIDFPLDEDFLTGLDMETDFHEFYKEIHEKELGIMDADASDRSFSAKTRAVLKRVEGFKPFIKSCVDKTFAGKTPVVGGGRPKFFMTQGGIGSGKTKLEKYAVEQSSGNYVIASIDDARALIPEYQLYIKAGHHSDDYKALRTFAYIIMGEIINKAIFENYNYFRDGSGIPYDKRNHELVQIMKDSGYETYILSAAAPLYIPKDRPDLTNPVHERILERYRKKHRAVPWNIVLNKHIGHPLALMQAVQDESSDHVVVFDNMSTKGSGFKIAETYWIEENFHNQLVTNNDPENLKNLIESLGFFEDINTQLVMNLKYLVASRRRKFDHRLLIYKDVYKILVIYNQDRFSDIIQKSKLNVDAQGYEDLPFNTLNWII